MYIRAPKASNQALNATLVLVLITLQAQGERHLETELVETFYIIRLLMQMWKDYLPLPILFEKPYRQRKPQLMDNFAEDRIAALSEVFLHRDLRFSSHDSLLVSFLTTGHRVDFGANHRDKRVLMTV